MYRSTDARLHAELRQPDRAVTSGTTYTDTGLAAGTYQYVVRAADNAGNLSALSARVRDRGRRHDGTDRGAHAPRPTAPR